MWKGIFLLCSKFYLPKGSNARKLQPFLHLQLSQVFLLNFTLTAIIYSTRIKGGGEIWCITFAFDSDITKGCSWLIRFRSFMVDEKMIPLEMTETCTHLLITDDLTFSYVGHNFIY
jgi:hypothetical protein